MAKYIDVERYCREICRCAGPENGCDKSKCPIWNAPDVKVPRWTPVTPETMPPYEKEFVNTTGDLLLRTLWNGYVAVYTGYYQDGRWWTYMETKNEVLSEGTFVTHWTPLEELLEGVKENEARNDG